MYIGLSWSCAELIARVANVKALSIALRRGGVNKVLDLVIIKLFFFTQSMRFIGLVH